MGQANLNLMATWRQGLFSKVNGNGHRLARLDGLGVPLSVDLVDLGVVGNGAVSQPHGGHRPGRQVREGDHMAIAGDGARCGLH